MKTKTVIVTGGAVGIGSAVVERLGAEGYNVLFTYRTSGRLAGELCERLAGCGARVSTVYCDITDTSRCEEVIRECIRLFGTPDALVNNAGIASQKLFTDITDSDWDAMLAADLSGAFRMTRAALPAMIRQKSGSIVNIASMWGQTGASCEVHYSAAKAGIIGMTRALAKEVAPSGIRVNCVAPGCVDTAMMSGFSEEDKAALCEEIPLGRIGRPEEIASAVSFLLSDDASYITGQVLGVNGGMVI